MKNLINWLEGNHLNHAAIVLIGMLPFSIMISVPIYLVLDISYRQAFNAGTLASAFVWCFGYYMREVMTFANLGGWRPLMPWLWSFHDRMQTAYAVLAALVTAFLLVI